MYTRYRALAQVATRRQRGQRARLAPRRTQRGRGSSESFGVHAGFDCLRTRKATAPAAVRSGIQRSDRPPATEEGTMTKAFALIGVSTVALVGSTGAIGFRSHSERGRARCSRSATSRSNSSPARARRRRRSRSGGTCGSATRAVAGSSSWFRRRDTPTAIAVGAGAVWVANGADATVSRSIRAGVRSPRRSGSAQSRSISSPASVRCGWSGGCGKGTPVRRAPSRRKSVTPSARR